MPTDPQNDLSENLNLGAEHRVRVEDFSTYSYWYLGFAIPQSVACAMFCVAQYAEIAIQLTYFVFMSTASLLIEELEERLKKISIKAKRSPSDYTQLSERLENWNKHYDFVCQLIEEINKCFNPILFITIGYLFITSSTSASEVVRGRSMLNFISDDPNEEGYYYLNSLAIIKACQVLLKFFIFLIPTVNLTIKVIMNIFIEKACYSTVYNSFYCSFQNYVNSRMD